MPRFRSSGGWSAALLRPRRDDLAFSRGAFGDGAVFCRRNVEVAGQLRRVLVAFDPLLQLGDAHLRHLLISAFGLVDKFCCSPLRVRTVDGRFGLLPNQFRNNLFLAKLVFGLQYSDLLLQQRLLSFR